MSTRGKLLRPVPPHPLFYHGALGDENVSAGRCKRVDDIGVDDGKPELASGLLANCAMPCQSCSHTVELSIFISIFAQYPAASVLPKTISPLHHHRWQIRLLIHPFPEVVLGKGRQRRTMNRNNATAARLRTRAPRRFSPPDIFIFLSPPGGSSCHRRLSDGFHAPTP